MVVLLLSTNVENAIGGTDVTRPGEADVNPPGETAHDETVPDSVRAAADKALTWLGKQQNPDGTWPAGKGIETTIPSLATMAFFAAGHAPGQGPYGNIINHAIDFVLSDARANGQIGVNRGSPEMYEHAISTIMLCQARHLLAGGDADRKARVERASDLAVKFILMAQNPRGKPKALPYTGGWRYQSASEDSDISATVWQLEALRAAADSGIDVPPAAFDAAREFVRRCAVPKDSGGGFAYQPASFVAPTRTGFGIVGLEESGQHRAPEALVAADYLLQHPLRGPDAAFYFDAVYHLSRAYTLLGGKYRDDDLPKVRDLLLHHQDAGDGAWHEAVGQEKVAGDAYRTSMAVLALYAPYRKAGPAPKPPPPDTRRNHDR